MYQKILTLVSKEYKIQDYMCYPFIFLNYICVYKQVHT